MGRKSSPTDSATSGITFEVPDEADAEIARVLEGRSSGLDLAMDSDGELSQEDGGSVASSVYRDHETEEDAVSTVIELAEGHCRVIYKNRGLPSGCRPVGLHLQGVVLGPGSESSRSR